MCHAKRSRNGLGVLDTFKVHKIGRRHEKASRHVYIPLAPKCRIQGNERRRLQYPTSSQDTQWQLYHHLELDLSSTLNVWSVWARRQMTWRSLQTTSTPVHHWCWAHRCHSIRQVNTHSQRLESLSKMFVPIPYINYSPTSTITLTKSCGLVDTHGLVSNISYMIVNAYQ